MHVALIAAAAMAQIWVPPTAPANARRAASRVSLMWPSAAAAGPRFTVSSDAATVAEHQWVIQTVLNITEPCEACCSDNKTCAAGSCQQYWDDPTLHICVPEAAPWATTCATHPGAIECPVGQLTAAIFGAASLASVVYATVQRNAALKDPSLVI